MGRWTRGLIIGRGASAAVSLVTTASGELMAVKSAELSSSGVLQKEGDLISQLSSPFVVKFLGSDVTCENGESFYNLLMEYVPGGTLSDQIRRRGGSLEEALIRKYASEILRGLDYLHSRGIVHCDIKGQNVLIGKDGAKIADFGCAKKVEEGNGIAGKLAISGTPLFMAPEVARGEEQGFAADIWAVGCIIVEMASGNNPWPNLNDPVSALYRIGYSGDLPEFPKWLSNSGKDFLSKCLNRDAKERWTAKELLQHPFFDNKFSDEDVGFVRNSPTSVLDQAFWNSMEVPEFSHDSSDIVLSLDSLANRIKNLIGHKGSSDTSFCNWTNDEDWITVRSIDREEIPEETSPQNDNSDQGSELAMEPFLLPLSFDSSVESVNNSLILLSCFDDEISVNVGMISSGTNLKLSSESAKDAFDSVFALDILYFETEIMRTFFYDNCRIFRRCPFYAPLF